MLNQKKPKGGKKSAGSKGEVQQAMGETAVNGMMTVPEDMQEAFFAQFAQMGLEGANACEMMKGQNSDVNFAEMFPEGFDFSTMMACQTEGETVMNEAGLNVMIPTCMQEVTHDETDGHEKKEGQEKLMEESRGNGGASNLVEDSVISPRDLNGSADGTKPHDEETKTVNADAVEKSRNKVTTKGKTGLGKKKATDEEVNMVVVEVLWKWKVAYTGHGHEWYRAVDGVLDVWWR